MKSHPKRSVFAHSEWFTKRTTVLDAEKNYEIRGHRIPLVGYSMWERLKSMLEAGDELWEFSSPDQSWQSLGGIAGIALVREGEIIYTAVTLQN